MATEPETPRTWFQVCDGEAPSPAREARPPRNDPAERVALSLNTIVLAQGAAVFGRRFVVRRPKTAAPFFIPCPVVGEAASFPNSWSLEHRYWT